MRKKHLLLMLLCCLIPLAGIAAISLFRMPASSVLYFGFVLLCPLMHVLLMAAMRRDHTPASGPTTAASTPSCHPASDAAPREVHFTDPAARAAG